MGGMVFKGSSIYVEPRRFTRHKYSTIPSGTWSFWFEEPIYFGHADFLLSAAFKPDREGLMEFDFENRSYIIKEYVVSKPVRVDTLYIDHMYEFAEEVDFAHCPLLNKIFSDGEVIGDADSWGSEEEERISKKALHSLNLDFNYEVVNFRNVAKPLWVVAWEKDEY